MKHALLILRRALTPRSVLVMAGTIALEYVWLSSVVGRFPAFNARVTPHVPSLDSIETAVCVVFVGGQIPVIVADIIDGFLQWLRPGRWRS